MNFAEIWQNWKSVLSVPLRPPGTRANHLLGREWTAVACGPKPSRTIDLRRTIAGAPVRLDNEHNPGGRYSDPRNLGSLICLGGREVLL